MYNPQETEKQILEFWNKNKIFEKSKKKNAKGNPFYLMDGPPYATGHIHMGTALNKILKDVSMRIFRLQGYDVFDRAGYDTHGVPIEFQIEKEIGSKSKKDIEKYGVKKFIERCKSFATEFIGVMNEEFKNLGAWMDFDNPYLTLNDEYVETIWDTFKVADQKKLLYLGKYPVHICPRCETAVAYNEIEYSKQEDTSIFVKFPLKDRERTFLIIWTTTPWTLPGNTGVMVNPNFIYQEVELSNKEKWIMAKELVPKIMGELGIGYTPKQEYNGSEMEGLKYENPLFNNLKLKIKDAYRVVLSGRYVNLSEGTGLVHCAPGHGKEDYEVGKEAGIDAISPVDINGLLTEEAGKYAGKKARIVDEEIIKDLEEGKFLVYKLKYTHDYPLCWRCKSPLLMVSQPQWFLKISEIHSKLLKENEETNWIPDWMKTRMNAWLEGISDWPVSRKRYWGTPLPIWICEKCSEKKVIGSRKELEKLGAKVNGVHKPEIDEVKLKCKCGGEMKRVEEVLDVWFDSGVSSWAALNNKEFEKFWPADLNLEGKDQVRGWWNSQLILSQIKFDKKPFKNIIVHGMVLDLGKKKMSKSLGNIISPKEIIEKYGRDYLRYYFTKTSKGEDFAFDEAVFKDIQNAFRVLTNVNTFVSLLEKTKSKLSIEDKWVLTRYHSMVKNATEKFNSFRYPEAMDTIEKFLVVDVSKTYIHMIRERSNETYEVLNEIRLGLLKMLAPAIPFITEFFWQELREKKMVKEESIHLTTWPKADEKAINTVLEENFAKVLGIIESGLSARDKAQIGLKWPLAKATLLVDDVTQNIIEKEFEGIIKSQLNVKGIEYRIAHSNKEPAVELDTKLTPELEEEGYAREIARRVQAARKNAGLNKGDKIELAIATEINLENQKNFIKDRTDANRIAIDKEIDESKYKSKEECEIKGKKVKILFSKI